MGIVVAAHHVDLHSRFALKIMRPDTARDPESVERFLREARAAVQLRSEHCVRVIDVGRLENESPYMVMELLEGRDLGQLVGRDGARSASEAVDYILQACEGIAEAHARGIVHRDLKPQNLFVTKAADGKPLVKVLDFGLAKSLATSKEMRALTQTSAVMGSPLYMSPEQMRASRKVDTRSDTWSLGVCLHELLTGRAPFDGATFAEVCSAVLTEPPLPMPSDVPRGLVRIVYRCLEKNPLQRFESVADLASALEEFAPARGSADRIRAILAAHAHELMALSPPDGIAPDSEIPSTATIDTLRRPKTRQPPWRSVGAGVLAFVATAIVTMSILQVRSPPQAEAPAPLESASHAGMTTTTASTPEPTEPGEVTPSEPALVENSASSAAPPSSASASPEPAPPRRLRPHPLPGRRPAASTPAAAPSSARMKPKTSEF